jgi:pimeloyl-ACP methyl ester carboxylesterase
MTSAERLVVRAADGRELEVLRDGPHAGLPLVFHGGTPIAPAEFPTLDAPVRERGWQLVSYTRPGYAGSTRHDDRVVADAAGDVACEAAASLAGVAPFDALDFLAGMAPGNVEESGTAARSRAALEALLEPKLAERAALTGDELAVAWGALIDDVDRDALSGELAESVAGMIRCAVSAGLEGWIDDLAFVSPWGFEPAQVAVPVSVWHGAHDRMVPFAHGRWLAEHIQGATAHLHDDEGHISLLRQVPRVLDDLVSRRGA